ncbi:putative complex I intermediate-associated protein 30 [Glycine soja]|uniref:Putative complex I intermediate-associated protein 30 n=1 Tax=Glycine soja TaxID=3848 RepID=A0A445GCY9_GLYSO|nr:putative complex I intermediate-associated protein 30 [Glycine soja]
MSRLRRLIQASVDATKKVISGNLDDLMPPPERPIFSFNSKQELSKWHLYSDSEFGGLSSASLQITESENGATSGIFSGNLSLDVSEGSKWNITRSGFCGMRSKKAVQRVFIGCLIIEIVLFEFDGFIDLDSYDTIAMKLKGDGRCYISTIYTENWVNSPGQMEDNSWQAFVYVPEGNWYIMKEAAFVLKKCVLLGSADLMLNIGISIPLARYLPTWRGNVIDAQIEMNPSRVLGMSLSVNAEGGVPGARSGPGDFRVELDWIKAMRTE